MLVIGKWTIGVTHKNTGFFNCKSSVDAISVRSLMHTKTVIVEDKCPTNIACNKI